MTETRRQEDDFSFYSYFIPFTPTKAAIWIVVIGLIVYFNMLFNGFVWDDLSYIVFNPYIHTVNILSLLKENSFNNGVGQYRAVTAIYFALLYSLFNNTQFFY